MPAERTDRNKSKQKANGTGQGQEGGTQSGASQVDASPPLAELEVFLEKLQKSSKKQTEDKRKLKKELEEMMKSLEIEGRKSVETTVNRVQKKYTEPLNAKIAALPDVQADIDLLTTVATEYAEDHSTNQKSTKRVVEALDLAVKGGQASEKTLEQHSAKSKRATEKLQRAIIKEAEYHQNIIEEIGATAGENYYKDIKRIISKD